MMAAAAPVPGPSLFSPNAIRVLLVSDIHVALGRITQLGEWLARQRTVLDLVLCAGDWCNLRNEGMTDDGEEERILAEAEGQITVMLSALENICARIVYVPGNHDPRTTFGIGARGLAPAGETTMGKEEAELGLCPQLSPHSVNAHANVVELAPGLLLAGWGGSVTATRGGEPLWPGFPYSEAQMHAGLCGVLARLGSPVDGAATTDGAAAPEQQPQLILLTHCGPAGACTATDCCAKHGSLDEKIETGSEAVRRHILSAPVQARCFLAIHGHTHASPGQACLGAVRVVNPGSLAEGSFALLTLERRGGTTRQWDMSRFELLRI